MRKATSLQSLIYRNYLKGSLIPILLVEVLLLLLYFGINAYTADNNQRLLLSQTTQNLQEIAVREVENINTHLEEVSRLAQIMQRDHQAFFASADSCTLPHGEPQFATHPNGVYFKLNRAGGSLYYSSSTPMGVESQRKARCSEQLDPLLQHLVETNPLITQAYLNTWDDMNRLYPFMPDAPGQYGPVLQMEDYNFYYLADAEHNPARSPVWTGAYLDPAGQGWMISNVVPIYNGDFLEGVSGLDVTIDTFVDKVLQLQMPWEAQAFMVDHQGKILAMPARIEHLLGLKELKGHHYSENIRETIEKPEEFSILNHPNRNIRFQMQALFESEARVQEMSIGGGQFLVSQEIVPETGWRMITIVDESLVFAPIWELKAMSSQIGYLAIAIMVLFYLVFFVFLLAKSKRVAKKIARPIERLAAHTHDFGNSAEHAELTPVGIGEIDELNQHFNRMTVELDKRTDELLKSQLREVMSKKEAEILEWLAVTDQLTQLYNRRKLNELLNEEVLRADRYRRSCGILLLDIDNFKQVNDTHGHLAGDELLVVFARLLKNSVRTSDTVGRWGGEEFIIICPETRGHQLHELAEKLRQLIAGTDFPEVKRITTSIGIAEFAPGDDMERLIARADRALYQAKAGGRNRTEMLGTDAVEDQQPA